MTRRDVLWILGLAIGAIPLVVDVVVPGRVWEALNPQNFNVYYDEFLYFGLTAALLAMIDFILHATDKSTRHLLVGLSMAALALFMVVFLVLASINFGVLYFWSKNIVAINTIFLEYAEKIDLLFWSTTFLLAVCLLLAYIYQRTVSNRQA